MDVIPYRHFLKQHPQFIENNPLKLDGVLLLDKRLFILESATTHFG